MKALALLILFCVGCGDEPDAPSPTTDSGAQIDAQMDLDSGAEEDSGPDTAVSQDDVGTSQDTWGSFAMSFFATYCIECHAGASNMSPRDYRTIDDVIRDQETVACGVSPDSRPGCDGVARPSQFPIGSGPRPSDEDRRRLVEWIDNGLSE